MQVKNEIIVDEELLLRKLNIGEFNYCTELLRDKFKLEQNEEKLVLSSSPSQQSIRLIGEILIKFSPTTINEDELFFLKQCFQSLRNCATYNKQIQNEIVNNSNIIESTYNILKVMLNQHDSICTKCLQMQLQFLCNVIVGNEHAQLVIWRKFSELFFSGLARDDLAHIVSLILYNIFNQNNTFIPDDFEFSNLILRLYSRDIENVQLLLELLITTNLIGQFYNDFSSEFKLKLLNLTHELLIENSIKINLNFIITLATSFKQKSDCILQTAVVDPKTVDPIEVSKLLDCISSASSNNLFLKSLQNDKSLLLNCASLLRSIHNLSKTEGNNFTAIQKLSELNKLDDYIWEHPGFGFKAGLIRLLGNLCWKHKGNQDLVRELDCITLLLDCCNIDARNPLIIQWVILGIRNLCDNNPENQHLISQLTKIGVVDSATIKEFGLTLHDDGDQNICIAPFKFNK